MFLKERLVSLDSWLAAVGVAAGLVALFIFAPKLRLVWLYAISLPAFVLGWLSVSGRISLDWLPVWFGRPLMDFAIVPAVVTIYMLVSVGVPLLFGGPLNRRYVTSFACVLTFAVSLIFTVYIALNGQWTTLPWHMAGSAYGVGIVSLARRKFS